MALVRRLRKDRPLRSRATLAAVFRLRSTNSRGVIAIDLMQRPSTCSGANIAVQDSKRSDGPVIKYSLTAWRFSLGSTKMGPKGVRTAIVVIAILTGIIVALVAGILVRSGGGSVTSAALSGGGSFGATVVLVLTIAKFLDLVP